MGRSEAGRRRVIRAGAVALGLALLAAACAKEAPYGVTDQSETFTPSAVPWNGVKVYLSSPRHASSGSRGECGWEENVNGRTFNLYAAHLNDESPGDATLTDRGYEVRVSANTRDDGWRLNRDESDNWGANVHLVTHSNAFEGCGNTAQYLLVMFKTGNANSMNLRNELLAHLDPQVPGGQNTWNCDGLGECAALAEHITYIELFFHTNQAAVDWFTGPVDDPDATGAEAASPYLGIALDEHLGYPRATPTTEWPLDHYPGFGRSPDATLRDLTIAYAEAFEREQSIAACMADAGFTYEPAVAFPAEDTRAVADALGVEPAAAPPSSWAANRAYEQDLPAPDRDRYFRTLLNERAADIDQADRTGAFPTGRGADFATGGCHRTARAAVPSIWDAPRAINTTLSGVLADLPDAPAMADTRARYADCVASASDLQASTPAQLEKAIVADEAQDDAVKAYDTCSDVWAAGYQDAAQAPLTDAASEQAAQLAEVAARYEDAMDQVATDTDLLHHLASATD